MIKDLYNKAKGLRSVLHENAEVSNMEYKTKIILMDYLRDNTSVEIHDIGQWFYAYRKADIPTERSIAFRADIDAVKIGEDNIGHYCGHDGHSATLATFLELIDKHKISKNVYAVFENAEETGDGALKCAEFLNSINIDEVYGYHNIPGAKEGTILLKEGTFACASNGMIVRFNGAVSHAAYPESGHNPSFAFGKLINYIEELNLDKKDYVEFITIVGTKMGDKTFGVSCGDGELYLTLRSEIEESLNLLNQKIINKANELALQYSLKFEYEMIEPFPETRNHLENVQKLKNILLSKEIHFDEIIEPFHWSEDFGHFLKLNKGAFFGVGNGYDSCDLHTVGYEFNDRIIPIVWMVYINLLDK